MAFAKGKSGNPGGKRQEKLLSDELRRVLSDIDKTDGSDRKRLHRVVEKLVEKAEEGEIQAIREVFDRLEGKPAQAIVGDGDEPIEHVIRWAVKAQVETG